jgi:hypothetical protein
MRAPYELNKSAWVYFGTRVNKVYQKEKLNVVNDVYRAMVKDGQVEVPQNSSEINVFLVCFLLRLLVPR